AVQLHGDVLVFKNGLVMVNVLPYQQVEGNVFGSAEGGVDQRRAADVSQQVEGKAVRHIVQQVRFDARAAKIINCQLLNTGAGKGAVVGLAGQVQTGNAQPGQAGAAGKDARLLHIGDVIGRKLHAGQRRAIPEAGLPNGLDAAGAHVEGGQHRVAAESIGRQLGHIVFAAGVLDAVRQHQ